MNSGVERLELVEPDIGLEMSYRAYMDSIERTGRKANYGGVLAEFNDDFAALIGWFGELRAGEHLPSDCLSGRVYWLLRDGTDVVGESQLVEHSDIGYTIGYVIHADERLKGYGTKILALTLEKARMLGATFVLLTCRMENAGSVRVIERNGGRLYEIDVSPSSGRVLLRYRIDLSL